MYKNARDVFVFASTPCGEVITDPIIKDLIENNKNCYIPYCTKSEMHMVAVKNWKEFECLPLNRFGVCIFFFYMFNQVKIDQGASRSSCG